MRVLNWSIPVVSALVNLATAIGPATAEETAAGPSLVVASPARPPSDPNEALQPGTIARVAALPASVGSHADVGQDVGPPAESSFGTGCDETGCAWPAAPVVDCAVDCAEDCAVDCAEESCGCFLAGAEIFWVRPHFSEAVAMTVQSTNRAPVNNVVHIPAEDVFFEFPYDVSYRVFAGYRLDEYGRELRFTYTRLRGSDSVWAAAGPDIDVDAVGMTASYLQGFPADTMAAEAQVRGDVYDVEFAHDIRLGNDSCSCPRWDLRWSAGARIAAMGHDRATILTSIVQDNERVDQSTDYIGAGPKVGLDGRRYFGGSGQFAVYGLWEAALLLGEFDQSLVHTTYAGANTVIESNTASSTRAIPVMGMELGASFQPTCHWTFSAGWFFQAWWDLDMATGGTTVPNCSIRDDANIMSWDGLTLRAAFCY